jgi:hypothetical protein
MSKNWGRTPIVNADKRPAYNIKYFVETDIGPEMRIERRPMGRVEPFVDLVGNICNVQMFSDGDSRRLDTEQRLRLNQHRKGHVEYAKCPLRHGNVMHAQRDFAKMPAELKAQCNADPRPFERRNMQGEPAQRGEPSDLYAGKACPHIEWLIEHRREQAREEERRRNPHIAAAERDKKLAAELQAAQAELVKEQLAEKRARKSKAKDVGE